MSVMAFDTHQFVKQLTAAGFSEPQAEAVTAVVRQAREAELREAATKGDVAVAVETLRKEIAESKADLLKWIVSAIGFQTVAVIGAVLAAARFINPA